MPEPNKGGTVRDLIELAGVRMTHDVGILDQTVPNLEGRSVKSDEVGYYDLPDIAEQPGTLYEHCVRAIKRGFNFGKHGLPLIGSGDWNDSFNLVGHHGANRSAVATYKVVPYVVAADVHSVGAHSGRGGWTWHTGSSGWMYRLITQTLLGLHRKGDLLRLDPKVPTHWRRFEIRYQYGSSTYHLFFTRGDTPMDTTILIQAGHHEVHENRLKLRDDGGDHRVPILFSGAIPSKSTPDQTLRQDR
ncbi:MAG: hypothetical protein JNK85_23800 [Verrucomicrobiales bacterium]|nr:hypothetical protein [Verrucomicrobiales bacterium]